MFLAFQIIQYGTSQPLATNNLIPEPGSTSSTIYECLFIDPDLPICDPKLWVIKIFRLIYYSSIKSLKLNFDLDMNTF